jgi:hypothetical protein
MREPAGPGNRIKIGTLFELDRRPSIGKSMKNSQETTSTRTGAKTKSYAKTETATTKPELRSTKSTQHNQGVKKRIFH